MQALARSVAAAMRHPLLCFAAGQRVVAAHALLRVSFPYALALLATATMTLIRWLLDPYIGVHYPFVFGLFAVFIAARYCGWKPAVLAALTGFVIADSLFIDSRRAPGSGRPEYLIGLLAYGLVCAGVILLSESERVARHRLNAANGTLKEKLSELSRAALQSQKGDAALSRSEAIYRETIESIPALVWVYDAGGKPLMHNRRWYDYTGQSQEDVAANRWHEMLHPDDAIATRDIWDHCTATGDQYSTEYRIRRFDGTFRWFLAQGRAIRGPSGIERWVGICTDIDERKRAEHRLTTQNAIVGTLEEAADLAEAAPKLLRAVCETHEWDVGVLWRVDLAAKVLRCVDVWHSASVDAAEFCDESLRSKFPSEVCLPGRVWATRKPAWIVDISKDPNMQRAEMAAVAGLHGGFAFPITFGAEVLGVAEFFSRESRTPDEELLGLFANLGSQIGQFIERKRNEAGLRLFRALIDRTMDAIEVIDPRTGKFLDVNEKACTSHGYTREEYLSLGAYDLDPLVAAKPWEEITAARQTGSHTIESVHRRKDGSTFPVEINFNFIQLDRDYTVAVVRDITERRRTELEMRKSQSLLAVASRIGRMGAWAVELPELKVIWSDELRSIHGFPPGHSPGVEEGLNLYTPEYRDAVRQAFFACVQEGEPFDLEVEIDTVQGIRLWVRVIGEASRDAGGAIVQVQGAFQDISGRKRIEAALHLRDRAIRASTQGIIISDPTLPDNPLVYVNPAFEQITGYPAEEALGHNCRFLTGVGSDPEVVAAMREALRKGEVFHGELINYRKDGSQFWNELSISPIRDAAGTITNFVGVQSDVTERRNLEDQFRQAQKMEAVGQLAGGVAHDFNNLLTIINGYSELLIEAIPEGDPRRAMLEEICKAGTRSAGLTRQLLAFSRQQVLAPQVLDLNEIVREAEKMLGRLIGEDIQLHAELAPKLDFIKADPGQIEQVLMNLLVNARDAMPQGGKLTIETRNVELSEEYAHDHPEVSPGHFVMMSVTDTGEGMTEAVRRRLFEPFFTTKGVGKGTGLGLAVVHGIVRQSSGTIEVYSEPGVGTSFKIYLPQVKPSATAETQRRESGPAPRGSETILLAEDDAAVRLLTLRALRTNGYVVLEATSGEEALRVAGQFEERIHLLVTDVVMPGMGGRLLAEQLQALHPQMKVLYLSGYTDDAVIRHGILQAEVNFLQKPFSPLALAHKVRAVLSQP